MQGLHGNPLGLSAKCALVRRRGGFSHSLVVLTLAGRSGGTSGGHVRPRCRAARRLSRAESPRGEQLFLPPGAGCARVVGSVTSIARLIANAQARALPVVALAMWRSHGIPMSDRLVDARPSPYPTSTGWAVLCFVPKGGSSAWKGMLVQALVEQGYAGLRTNASAHFQLLPYSISDLDLRDAPWLMFVRHPITRLLSGFLDKAEAAYNDGRRVERSPSEFARFVHFVTSSPASTLDLHFQLQSEHCALRNGAKYHHLRVETMGIWYRQIMCMLSLQQAHQIHLYRPAWQAPCPEPPCCFVRTLDCGCHLSCDVKSQCGPGTAGRYADASFGSFMRGNQSGSSNLEYWYDEKLANRVNAWAKEDYDRFGYLPWRPGQSPPRVLYTRRT